MAEFRLPAKARFTSLFIPFLLPAQFISRHPNRMYNEQPIDLSTRNVPCFASFLTVGIPGPTGNGNRNNYRCPSFDRVDGRGHWIRFHPSRFEYEFFYRCLERRMRVIDVDYRFEVFVQSLQEDCFLLIWIVIDEGSRSSNLILFVDDINIYMIAHWWSKFVTRRSFEKGTSTLFHFNKP